MTSSRRRGTSSESPLLSVVVPTRNEAGNVEPLVRGLAAALAGIATEVIFVDDSSDATPQVLESLASRRGGLQVNVVHRPAERQNGLGPAAVEGLKLARGSAVAVMDGDLQHPPELLPQMLTALRDGDLDVVVASRYVRGGSARGLSGPARRVVSSISRRLAQAIFREARKTSDPLSGYFLCRRSAIEGVEFRPIGFKILLEVLVCAPDASVGDIPLRFGRRHAGLSNASIAQGWLFLRHMYSLVVQVRGSARFWKYAIVGGAGLAVFLALLVGGRSLGLGNYQAWALAFLVSLFLNWQLNRVFTFADIATPFTLGRSHPVYLPVALLGGSANLLVFALLVGRTTLIFAGAGGAVAAMAINYLAQRGLLSRPARNVSGPAGEPPIQNRIAALLGGEVRLILPETEEADTATMFGTAEVPLELMRAAERRKPLLLAEAPSSAPQLRHDVGMSAWLAVPVLEGRHYRGMVVAHRHGQPYSADELDLVLRSLRRDAREEIPGRQLLQVPDGGSTEAG